MRPSAENDVTEYVVGFAFDWDGRVALIRKNRPEWQAGRLNGIGGHVEPGEHPNNAMWREFHEETGTALSGWQKYVVMDFPGARIHFYRLLALDPQVLNGLRSMTDEEVALVWPGDANRHLMIPNLTWLIPLAAYTADTYQSIHVHAAMAEALTRPIPPAHEPPAWCLCGVVDDRGDGTCGNCGLRIMADEDELQTRPIPPANGDTSGGAA